MRVEWMADEAAGVICECGEELTIDIYEETEEDRKGNTCPKCGRRYRLVQYVEEVKA